MDYDSWKACAPESDDLVCQCGHLETHHDQTIYDEGSDCHIFETCQKCGCRVFTEKTKLEFDMEWADKFTEKDNNEKQN